MTIALLALLLPAATATAEEGAAPAKYAAVAPTEQAGAQARDVVESLHQVLLSCMKRADQLKYRGRYDRISAEVDEAFDLPFMARVSVGSAWKDLDERERSEFVQLSQRLTASNYTRNFDGYGGQTFETHYDEPAARGTVVVKTTLSQPDGDDVRFDYRLRETDGSWRIIDVQLNGMVSELTLRRAQYRSVIEREGYPAFRDLLEQKIDDLSPE